VDPQFKEQFQIPHPTQQCVHLARRCPAPCCTAGLGPRSLAGLARPAPLAARRPRCRRRRLSLPGLSAPARRAGTSRSWSWSPRCLWAPSRG
jgi:hypothetical protein